ncbi:MAG TPA: O-antigen ligase family protein, partial [Bryobacteraceae bacterium]|nr:O-antigen ligase family protein [Bryobacteraceae bacterium]
AAWALLRLRQIPNELAALKSRTAGLFIIRLAVLSLIWFSIATAVSIKPSLSLFGSAWRQFGLVTFISTVAAGVGAAAFLAADRKRIAFLLRTTVCAGLLDSVYGIAQYFGFDPLQPGVLYRALDGDAIIVRPPGTLGHADYFGWWLAIEFFCCLALARLEQRAWRYASWASAALTGMAIVLTGTRSAGLAVVAGLLSLPITSARRPGRRQMLAGALAVAALIGFVLSSGGERIRARIAWSLHEPPGGARPVLWRDSLSMARAKPLFGFGPETFSSAFLRYESEDLAHLYPDLHPESPHNVALDTLTATGIPGLLLLLAWGWTAVLSVRSALRAGSPAVPELAAALVASAVCSIFSSVVLPPVLLSFFVLGSLVALSQPSHEVRMPIPVYPGKAAVFALSACAGMLLICVGAVALADFRLARFQRNPDAANYQSFERIRFASISEDIYCSRTLANNCPALPGAARIECWNTALQAAVQATSTADDPANAWYNLAMFTAAQNDTAGTAAALRKASAIAPEWFKPHWILAKALSRSGERSLALHEAQRARSLNHNRDAEVTRTVSDIEASSR